MSPLLMKGDMDYSNFHESFSFKTFNFKVVFTQTNYNEQYNRGVLHIL